MIGRNRFVKTFDLRWDRYDPQEHQKIVEEYVKMEEVGLCWWGRFCFPSSRILSGEKAYQSEETERRVF